MPLIKKSGQVILICLIGIFLCFGLYFLFDVVWNGSLVDWFEFHYMITHEKYASDVGRNILVNEPNWIQIKALILTLLCVSVVAWIFIVWVVSHFYARLKVKQSITYTSCMLHDCMTTEKENVGLFPKEYAEIYAQTAEIKLTIQHHRQILKEEAAKKNDLIAYLAHDLKTPLTSVIGYLVLLDEAQDMPIEQKAKYINVALDKALRLEKLINEFFDITRYHLQQIDLDKEPIDLYYMLAQMTDEFYPLLNAHGNTTKLNVDENLTIYGDSIKLARVFNNLLKNAIAYSYPDTPIEIWAEDKASSIEICFCNKGKTIPPQKLNSVFEKFFRLDESRSTNTGGAGLGLAIAKEIITLHEGKITANSENELTTFCVSLPAQH